MSLPDDDRPQPAPPRDPLLDDAVFAEIVEPAVPVPRMAEPVEVPSAADLPVAELVQPEPAAKPRAKAFPVRPRPKESDSPRPKAATGPTATEQGDPPRPQWIAACGVIGCLGVLVIGSIALLAWIAITILSKVGELTDLKKDNLAVMKTSGGARIGPIAATALTKDGPLALDGAADAVGRGAGGRYLLLRIPRTQQLEVFDANKGKIVLSIPLGEKNALFAAGARTLFVFKPMARMIERFELATGQSELEVPLPSDIKLVDAIAIGPGSEGPLYLFTVVPGKPSLLHVMDTASLAVTASHPVEEWLGRDDRQVHARASFDGTLIGVAGAKSAATIRLTPGQKPHASRLLPKEGSPPLLATPSPDGQYLYTARGVFDPDAKPLRQSRLPFFSFPTAHGSGLFVRLEEDEGKVTGFPRLYAAGGEPPNELVALTKGEVSGDVPANELREFTIPADERVHLWPGAGLLAVLPISNDKLQLYKVDVQEDLKHSAKGFIAFATDPPITVARGGEWQYMPRFWTRGEVETMLSHKGPLGMKLESGRFTWSPPGNATPGPFEVSITAETLTGRKAVQKFRIWVVE